MVDIFKGVVIIGGGPAGVSCAIQLMREGIEVLIISPEIGGLVKNANLIENVLGYPSGITGKKFVRNMKDQLDFYPYNWVKERVIKISLSPLENDNNDTILIKEKSSLFIIETTLSSNNLIYSRFVIIASGTIPRKLKIPGAKIAEKDKILHYDLSSIKRSDFGKHFFVIGGGDVAYDYALNLYKHHSRVTIIQRKKYSKCNQILKNRIASLEQDNIIKIYRSYELSSIEIYEDTMPELIKLNIISTRNQNNLKKSLEEPFSNILVAIGRNPNLSLLSSDLFNSYQNNEKIPNLYYIGDIKNGSFRQISICQGEGVKLAMELAEKIMDKNLI